MAMGLFTVIVFLTFKVTTVYFLLQIEQHVTFEEGFGPRCLQTVHMNIRKLTNESNSTSGIKSKSSLRR